MNEKEFYGRTVVRPVHTNTPSAQVKDTIGGSLNPKDAQGVAKVPLHHVPSQVMMEVGLAMMEGARKYGSHNYRIAGVRTSVYYDALQRHVMAFWEGQDNDPDSGLSHITKAIATLVVLRDAYITGNVVDDRPPATQNVKWVEYLNAKSKALIEKYPVSKSAYTWKDLKIANVPVDLNMPTNTPHRENRNNQSPVQGPSNGETFSRDLPIRATTEHYNAAGEPCNRT